jgi:sporulation protein YlmC with PRC-barrel domain
VRTKDLLDKEVIGSSGMTIGKVVDVDFETKNWQITAIEVDLVGDIAKEFGMKKRFRGSEPLLVSVHHVRAVSDRILLDTNKDELFALVASSPH